MGPLFKNIEKLAADSPADAGGGFQPDDSGKARWPAAVAYIAVGILTYLLSDYLTLGPTWLVLAVDVPLVVLLILFRRRGWFRLNRILALTTTGLITLTLAFNAIALVTTLPDHKRDASTLLKDSLLIWVTNIVVFTIWYWEVDAGGPAKRHAQHLRSDDFLFPQMAMDKDKNTPIWSPSFLDYLFLAFNTSTAFSPTDTSVLSVRAKMLMMLQACISLLVVVVLAARAVNIL